MASLPQKEMDYAFERGKQSSQDAIEHLKATLRAVQDRLDFRPLDDAYKARDACDAIRGMVVDGLKGNP